MTELQKAILEIYKSVKIICDKEHIPYFAIYGTCLGAVRHKGFIPWDDDIDLGIPIEYWDKFISACKKDLPNNLYLYSPIEVRYFANTFLKVCNKNTTIFEDADLNIDVQSGWKGVWIDIMPICGVSNSSVKRKVLSSVLRKIWISNAHMRLFPQENPSLKSRIGRLPFRIMNIILPWNFFCKISWSVFKKHPLNNSQFIGDLWRMDNRNKVFFDNWFNNSSEMPFEDTTIPVPEDWDKYLTFLFGDYMTPVCCDNDIHVAYYDLQHPYSDYYGLSTEELKNLSVKNKNSREEFNKEPILK